MLSRVQTDLFKSISEIRDWTSIDDALEASSACVAVAELRSRDNRFSKGGPNVTDKTVAKYQALKRLKDILDACKEAERTHREDDWTKVLAIGCTLLSADTCRSLKIKRANAAPTLSRAAEALKHVLLESPTCSDAWIARGRVFLMMGVPALADVHFSQPFVQRTLRVQLQQEVYMAMEALQRGESRRRRDLASSLSTTDLLERAELLFTEGYLGSASLYWAACCDNSHVTRTDEIIGKCLLRIVQAWRQTKETKRFFSAIELCDYVWLLDPDSRSEALLERARWLYGYRDFTAAIEDLVRIAPYSLHTSEGTVREQLMRQATTRLSSGAFTDRAPCAYLTGHQLISGAVFGGISPHASPPAFRAAQLFIISNDIPQSCFATSQLVVSVGCLCGSLPRRIDKDAFGKSVQVVDCRNWFRWRQKRIAAGSFRTSDPHTMIGVISSKYFLLYPVDVSDRLIVEPARSAILAPILWEDVIATFHGLLRISTPGNSETRNLANVVLGRNSARHFAQAVFASGIASRTSTLLVDEPLDGVSIDVASMLQNFEVDLPRAEPSRSKSRGRLALVGAILILVCAVAIQQLFSSYAVYPNPRSL